MNNILCSQYEEKIRPCIDLIDSLRALGVEKDLALPAIAVIGDQSSGKSSVLEALSGVTLPRGSGIVTRCPLELKLKKAQEDCPWRGKIKYGEHEKELADSGEVEGEVSRAQDCMAGTGSDVSEDLITLEIEAPNVPDLTLIDLPGITRIALSNQRKDIGQQIKNMIHKYILKQQTISLVVVPSNVDIATTEALEMARQVDPSGERTLGILTKPDLVDKGAENQVISVVRNQVYALNKGFMIVKCRGQKEIQEKLSLEEALNNEKAFFEEHEHFSCLLTEGYATIPCLAEKLTTELVEHICKNLPYLENQIKTKLSEAEEILKMIGLGIPETEMEKLSFLIDKIRQFSSEISNATKGEEETTNGLLKLFTNVRKHFFSWEAFLAKSSSEFSSQLKDDMYLYENRYRGREFPGFVSFKTFENIVRHQVQTFEEPAITKLKDITAIVQVAFSEIASKQFTAFPNLYRKAKSKIEDICYAQQQEAEKIIKTYFKMESIIYCQDNIYGGSLKKIREEAAAPVKFPFPQTSQLQLSVNEMSDHIKAYFRSATSRLSNQVPLIIQYYILHEFANNLEIQMMHLIQDREKLDYLLQEKNNVSRERNNLKNKIKRLKAAHRRLAKFPG
ncbi:interferon-induced GTP-binding protein Mx2-like [Spea bombifrons]|uniref:interferon-induced GTP-binding protein Mx2-like n=1 Tax=Spea bombifrons TaxID=233779 RepID=UPI00234A94F9|nr:interferon-induced GTP-binding protein Mx2-like [Spea bombifrons]